MQKEALKTSQGSMPKLAEGSVTADVVLRPGWAAILPGAKEKHGCKPIPCISNSEKRIMSCTAIFFLNDNFNCQYDVQVFFFVVVVFFFYGGK